MGVLSLFCVTVQRIWKVLRGAQTHAEELFPQLKSEKYPSPPEELTFLHAEEILDMYPDLPRKQRETRILQDYPAINRDIRDVIRFDPRIYQDAAFVGAIHCAGASPRFNSLTVDGVRMNDAFGLNSNGYPTERMPFSYDAINQVAVEDLVLSFFDYFHRFLGLYGAD